MRRFSIAAMMMVVLVCGVAVAALRDASDMWVGVMLSLTLFLLGIAILGVLNRRDGRRAFWQGFALFGWGYLALAMGPWFSELSTRLPTTLLLSYSHGRLSASPLQEVQVLTDVTGTVTTSYGTWTASPAELAVVGMPSPAPAPVAEYIKFLTLTPSNQEHFVRVGHSLFTLLAALTGGLVGRWFHRSSEAA